MIESQLPHDQNQVGLASTRATPPGSRKQHKAPNLTFELCSQMWTLRCQSPSACTRPRAFANPAGTGGSVRADNDLGGKNTSNISPLSCPIPTSAVLATELINEEDDDDDLSWFTWKHARAGSWYSRDGRGVAVGPRYRADVAAASAVVVCLIAPLLPAAASEKANADELRTP